MGRLEEEVRTLETLGVDAIHFDFMDSHFVPNMPMGLGLLSSLRSRTSLPFDVHLMVEKNDWFIEEVARIGVEQVAIHVESAVHLDRSLSLIRSQGIKAGAALNPSTPLSTLNYVLDKLDFVLLMTVNPGFAGQKLVPATIGKIADCRSFLAQNNKSDMTIEVDGNVSFKNIPGMVSAGADILVAGSSSLYHRDDSDEAIPMQKNLQHMRQVIQVGLAERSGHPAAVIRDGDR